MCASTAMACQETDEFRPHTTRSASRELVRSLGPPGVAAVGLRYSFESVHAHESITVHQHASVESIILCSGCNMSACTQGLRFNVHTLFTHLVLTPLPGGVYMY